jgi:hypothetical protein
MRRCQTLQHLSGEFLDDSRFKLTAVLVRLTSLETSPRGHRNEEGIPPGRVVESPACESTIESALFCSRYLAANRMHWSAFLVQQVSEALERIDKCTYGLCLRCGQSIEASRLAALPWVALCISCQEGKSAYGVNQARIRSE